MVTVKGGNNMKSEIIERYLSEYEATRAHEATMVAFVYNHHAYMARVEDLRKLLEDVELTVNTKGKPVLRLRLHSKSKSKLLNHAKKIASNPDEVFKCLPNRNAGECFEAWFKMTYLNQPLEAWTKDSTPYYIDSDVTLYGMKLSLKADDATITALETIDKAMGR